MSNKNSFLLTQKKKNYNTHAHHGNINQFYKKEKVNKF